MNDLETFGRWVKMNRRALGLTQDEFAKLVYCAPITLRKIEGGQLRPSRELAHFIIECVGVSQGEYESLMALARVQREPNFGAMKNASPFFGS